MDSLKGGNLGSGSGSGSQQAGGESFTTLLDLLSPKTTGPVIEKASDELIDALVEGAARMRRSTGHDQMKVAAALSRARQRDFGQ